MIMKLICFIFGHRYWIKDYTNTHDINNEITNYYQRRWMDRCPRCGKKL